ncbi:hypothetical protein [Streptomyces sp. NPDC060184]|uniref:hypothetical protein n=1 Tax=Streptomyces sp. NPDC060184 TaxID=3347064 RepID=UPI00365E4335
MAIDAYENLQIVRGTVAEDGTRIAGHGFKATKVGTGKYLITFNNDFLEKPSVVANLDGEVWSGLDDAHVSDATTEKVTVLTSNSNGARADRAFHFIAMG